MSPLTLLPSLVMSDFADSHLRARLITVLDSVFTLQASASVLSQVGLPWSGTTLKVDIAVLTHERLSQSPTPMPNWIILLVASEGELERAYPATRYALKHGCELVWIINTQERYVWVESLKMSGLCRDPQAHIPVPVFAHELQFTVEMLMHWLEVES